jgi:hypothetical protein
VERRGAGGGGGGGRGGEDAGEARFRPAAAMVEMWRGLDLPAWVAPYALRDARLGYLRGYGEALVSGELSGERAERAARARGGGGWGVKLEAARERVAH